MPHSSCVLVRPPVDVLGIYAKPVESLALAYLASASRAQGHEVTLVDAMLLGLSVDETVDRILAARPDVVGITNVLNYVPSEIGAIGRRLREGGFTGTYLAGGHSTSFLADDTLRRMPDVDGVIIGEGEQSFPAVLTAVAYDDDWRCVPGVFTRGPSGPTGSPPRRIADLDALAPAARDLTSTVIDREGLVAISTSRGCYARCTFCSVPRFFGLHRGGHLSVGDWISRSAASVVSEIVDLHQSFGIRELLVVDDEFFGGSDDGHQRALDIASGLVAAGSPVEFAISCRAESVADALFEALAGAGLAHVFIGLESGVEADLRRYGKGISVAQNERAVALIKRLGLSFQAGFMTFHPQSTIQDVRRSLQFLQDIGECKPATFNTALDPHAGTPMLDRMDRDGALTHGPRLPTVSYHDPKVSVAREVAAWCGEGFQPFMNLIAWLTSAITYEWRRPVPQRSAEASNLIARFEDAVNDRFAGVLLDAVEALATVESAEHEEIRAEAAIELDRVVMGLTLNQALLLSRLNASEDLRYISQRQRIEEAVRP